MRAALHVSKTLPLVVLILLLTGCLPIPHHATVSPAITGRVRRNEKPIENALVSIENGVANCSFKNGVVVHTNDQGEFRSERRKQLRFFVVMDPAYSLRICIVEGDKIYEGWTEAGLGYPADMTLDCDLESNQTMQAAPGKPGKGVCLENSTNARKRKRK